MDASRLMQSAATTVVLVNLRIALMSVPFLCPDPNGIIEAISDKLLKLVYWRKYSSTRNEGS